MPRPPRHRLQIGRPRVVLERPCRRALRLVGLVGQPRRRLAHVELAGDDVGDQAGAVLAEEGRSRARAASMAGQAAGSARRVSTGSRCSSRVESGMRCARQLLACEMYSIVASCRVEQRARDAARANAAQYWKHRYVCSGAERPETMQCLMQARTSASRRTIRAPYLMSPPSRRERSPRDERESRRIHAVRSPSVSSPSTLDRSDRLRYCRQSSGWALSAGRRVQHRRRR